MLLFFSGQLKNTAEDFFSIFGDSLRQFENAERSEYVQFTCLMMIWYSGLMDCSVTEGH